jgi:hypothetical protein
MLKAMWEESGGERAQAEFGLLSMLHRAVLACAEISAPAPVAVFADVDAYLMTHVPGAPLRELANRCSSDVDRAAISSLIARGLHLYYNEADHSYADLHPGNVLYDQRDSSIYLLDPGHPSPTMHESLRWVEYGWAASDLGYWTFDCVVNDGRHAFRNLRGRNGLAAFTAVLLSSVADEFDLPRSEFVQEVVEVARSHCDRLARGNFRQRTLAMISRPWFAIVGRHASVTSLGSSPSRR